MFIDNFEHICKIKGLKPTPTLKECGISAGTATNWIKKRDVIPDGKTIIKLAKHLNVSTDYLLLGKEPSIPRITTRLCFVYSGCSFRKHSGQNSAIILSSFLQVISKFLLKNNTIYSISGNSLYYI